MPIRPENKNRYPTDWKAISLRVRERAKGRCECTGECGADHEAENAADYNYKLFCDEFPEIYSAADHLRCAAFNKCPHPITESKVVLTAAHLGAPAQLPFFLHVARNTVANEIFEAVGFLMPLKPELPEWHNMMYRRAATEFLGSTKASGAGFFVTFPSGPPSLSPTRAVVRGADTAAPVWISVASRSLLRKPFEAASITTEPTARADVKSAYRKLLAAAFADGVPEPALCAAYCFSMTGVRASPLVVRGLLGGRGKNNIAHDAGTTQGAFPWTGHASLYHADEYVENCSDENLKAMCQRCHNKYDAPIRAAGMRKRAHQKRAVKDFFE